MINQKKLTKIKNYSPECYKACLQYLWLKMIAMVPSGQAGHCFSCNLGDLKRYLVHVCNFTNYYDITAILW